MSYKTPNAIILEQLATKPTLYGLATLGRFRQEIFRLFVTNKMLNKYCEFFLICPFPFPPPPARQCRIIIPSCWRSTHVYAYLCGGGRYAVGCPLVSPFTVLHIPHPHPHTIHTIVAVLLVKLTVHISGADLCKFIWIRIRPFIDPDSITFISLALHYF